MDNITVLALFSMFSLTLVTLAVFARPETSKMAVKILGDVFSKLLKS